jgi:hypothetical protein
MSNLESNKSSVVYSALTAAMVNCAATATVTTVIAPFYNGVSKFVGVKYESGSAAAGALAASNAPYIVSVTPAVLSTTRSTAIVINLPIASVATYDGAIYRVYWVNETLPNANINPC